MEFDPVAYLNEPRWRTTRPGLDRIRELLDRVGRPQDGLRFVHVAGTNGKGSTCAYLDAILRAAGYRVGLFTSPYLEAFEERIRVDGEMIGADDLRAATCAVREAAEAMADHPTEYELMCAVALLHFSRRACDVVVFEVGLGGRLDATNVIDAPEACVIARIGLDHAAYLGNTLAEVAREKAGIVKEGAAVVSWPQDPEAMAEIESAAAACGAAVRTPDFSALSVEALGLPRDERALDARRRFSYARLADGASLETRMIANYQPNNAALALEAVLALRERGWSVSDDAVRAGIAAARWPGRFEVAGIGPLTIIDGAHNPQAARALADAIREALPGARPVFLVGVLEDKDYPAMLEEIVPLGAGFVVFEPDSPRALPARKLASAISWTAQDILGCASCTRPAVASDAADAVAQARAMAEEDGVVCACGSLYGVAAVKAALRR